MKIFTIGHSTKLIDEFIEILNSYSITQLVDIRTIPRSRHNPQFNADTLGNSLEKSGIGYHYLEKLGGLRKTSKESINTGWRNLSFRGYADYMQTTDFHDGLDQLVGLRSEEHTSE